MCQFGLYYNRLFLKIKLKSVHYNKNLIFIFNSVFNIYIKLNHAAPRVSCGNEA